jgi:DNA anti-recombination protein RmuC
MAISSDIESLSCSTFTFSTELRNRLQGRSLSINRESMNMKQLEILINNGFEAEKELLNPFHDALNALKLREKKEIDQLEHTIKEDAEIITRIGWKKSYRYYTKVHKLC